MTSEWPVIRPQSAEITTSNSQAVLGRCRDVELPSHTLFELPYPVARDGQVRVFAILQTNVQRSSGERRDFLDPLYVHDSAQGSRVAPRRNVERRSEEHTSELQSPDHLVCRLLLEKKKTLSS